MFDPASTKKSVPALVMPRGIGRHFCAVNTISAFSSSGVDIYSGRTPICNEDLLNLWLFLNSSIAWLLREVSGRKNLGGGMLKAEAADFKYFPVYFQFSDLQNVVNLYNQLEGRSALNPLEELETEEHRSIDDIVFNFLEINPVDRNSIVQYLKLKITQRGEKAST